MRRMELTRKRQIIHYDEQAKPGQLELKLNVEKSDIMATLAEFLLILGLHQEEIRNEEVTLAERASNLNCRIHGNNGGNSTKPAIKIND